MDGAGASSAAMVMSSDAFCEFYRRVLPDVYGYVLRLCDGDRAQAEDLTQDVWLALVEELCQGRTERADVRWLITVARSRFIDRARRERRRASKLELIGSDDGVTCGMGDIYLTRRHPAQGWHEPKHLGCDPAGPNSALDEQSPSYVQGQLYFSRSSGIVPGELFVSRRQGNGFGPADPIVELNDAVANDIQPNVRKDGRELVFSSNRTGGFGGPDIWISTRSSVEDAWSPPVNLGPAVNTAVGESRPFLSSDAEQLLFGRGGPAGEGGTGAPDIYVTTRSKGE